MDVAAEGSWNGSEVSVKDCSISWSYCPRILFDNRLHTRNTLDVLRAFTDCSVLFNANILVIDCIQDTF